MSEPHTYTLLWQFQCPRIVLYWVWFAPFGVPFVTECAVDDYLRLRLRLAELAKTSGDEKYLDKMWVIRVRGMIGRQHYTWKERWAHNREQWQYLDASYLPAWEWMIRDYEVLSVEEAHPLLDWWFSLLTLVKIIVIFPLIYWVVSCLPK